MTPRPVCYGEANFRVLREANGYFVDKTAYIPMLEIYKSPVYLRPRRFGKSFLCSMLSTYYDINMRDRFDEFFGDTYVGANPTAQRNSCLTLHFDFSVMRSTGTAEEVARGFSRICNIEMNAFLGENRAYFPDLQNLDLDIDASENLSLILSFIKRDKLPPLFVTIDEYDNFANQMIVAQNNTLYSALTADGSFFKTFFKTLKKGKGQATIQRIFITGVLPILIDELASGYNIADFLTLEEAFEAMVGFTQTEVDDLLDEIYADYLLPSETLDQVSAVIKDNYNGYHFVATDTEPLYNTTILVYFLRKLTIQRRIPKLLVDNNLKTDLSWVKRLTASNATGTKDLVHQLLIEGKLAYDDVLLTSQFDMNQFFAPRFYPLSFFFLGMVTRRDRSYMCLPNLNMKTIFGEYFNSLYQIDSGTRYGEVMLRFASEPHLPTLFDAYWRLYISQMPEAVFRQVNENFYRTTFYELCRRHLGDLYIWSMESSLASGRTDLEMTGQFHTPFNGTRYLMEFKYISNAEAARKEIDPETFEADKTHLVKLAAYTAERRDAAPKETVLPYLIYCFGNRGYRIFEPA